MSGKFKPRQRVRCTSTWTTHVIDRGSEYAVEEVDSDGTHVRVKGEWVPATYFESIPGLDDIDPMPMRGDAWQAEREFDKLADAIYEAMPEGQLYEAMADNVASAVIADGWMSRAAAGDAQAREADLIAGPLRRRLAEVEAERDDLESRLADLLCDLTDGRMSKTNYDVRTMVREVEAAFERHTRAEKAEAWEEGHDAAEAEGRELRSSPFHTSECDCGQRKPNPYEDDE